MPKNCRRLLAAAAFCTALALTGCSTAAPESSASPPASTKAGPVTITFWHESTGAAASAMATLVDKFNAEHKGRITVDASFQGTYADAQIKYTAAVQSQSTPSIMAMNDTSTGFMVDSKQTVPIHKFTAKDKSFDTKAIPPSARAYYSDSKGLLSMPYAVSQPMLYINPTIAQQAGLDPAHPPKTLEQVATWAQQIKEKTGIFGFSMNMVDSWILEELSANGGQLFCTPDNGRSNKQVSGISMTSSTQTTFLTTLQQLFQNGTALNPGTNSSNMTSAFTSGKVGMLLTSSAAYTVLKPTDDAKVDVVHFPTTSTSKNAGVVIGGASLWIDGPGHSTAEQDASYEFAKFLISPTSQAYWAKATGFLASNNKARSEPEGKSMLADPSMVTMYKQLDGNPTSQAASGCRMGPYAAVRTIVIGAFNKAIAGGDIKTEMKSAEQQAKKQIADYNSAIK